MGMIDQPDHNLETHDARFAGEERTSAPTGRSGRVFRRLTHNAGRILFLWLLISMPLVYGIYRFVEPRYQAYSMVKIESYLPELFDHSLPAHDGSPPSLLQTEMESIKSNPVLELAIASAVEPRIANHLIIRESLDPESELRKKLDIQIIPNTNYIRIAFESRDPQEAADIVNVVVDAYLQTTTGPGTSNAKLVEKQDLKKALMEGLKSYETGLQDQIDHARKSLRDLAARNDINVAEVTFLRDDLNRYYNMLDQVNGKLEQVISTKVKAGIRVQEIHPAEVPKTPFSNNRWIYIAIAPVAVLVSLAGLFLVFGQDRQ